MIETQLVFRNEYRFDLKKVNSVLIPYLFEESTTTLIIKVDAVASKNYRSIGRLDQVAIDYPNKLIASSQVIRFGNQSLYFPQSGRFQLEFYPNYYLGKTSIRIHKVTKPVESIELTLQRIEQTVNDIATYGGN